MSTNSPSELQQFCDFVAPQAAAGETEQSLDEAVRQFREYQRQLADLKRKLAEAESESAAGRSGPFDAEATKAAVRRRLAESGQ